MEVKDLKVESASVFVTNANEVDAKYRISAHFNTREGKLTRIENGSVTDMASSEVVANFYKNFEYGKSYNVTWLGNACDNKDLRCEIDEFIHQYIDAAEAKAKQESEE